MTKKITLHKKNESFLYLETEDGIHSSIRELFKFQPSNYKYHPAYKRGKWDGYLYLYNTKDRELPYGLYWPLKDWAKTKSYEITGDVPEYNQVTQTALNDFLEKNPPYSGGKIIKPYDHQVAATHMALIAKRMIIESSTSSGKSLIAYEICSYLKRYNYRGLYIVPTIGLVTQLEADFKDYAGPNKEMIDDWLHPIIGGEEKETDKLLVVSTWQSLQRLEPEWFESFDYVICDEVHTAQAASIKRIVESCVNAEYKIGMTGSLQESKAGRSCLIGLFGPTHKIMTNKEAIEKKIAADISICGLILRYGKEDRLKLYNTPLSTGRQEKIIKEYRREMDFLMQHELRNNAIVNIAKAAKNTTLILTQSREQAKLLFEKCEDACAGSVYLVYGETDPEEREAIRQFVETEKNPVIIATYGVFQQGISIKNIHNIIFASTSKSKVRVLQSIGRGLRLSKDKTHVTLIDICDIIRDLEERPNFSLKHFIKRLGLYKKEGFEVIKIEKEVVNEGE